VNIAGAAPTTIKEAAAIVRCWDVIFSPVLDLEWTSYGTMALIRLGPT
jgi:hypothetical protein